VTSLLIFVFVFLIIIGFAVYALKIEPRPVPIIKSDTKPVKRLKKIYAVVCAECGCADPEDLREELVIDNRCFICWTAKRERARNRSIPKSCLCCSKDYELDPLYESDYDNYYFCYECTRDAINLNNGSKECIVCGKINGSEDLCYSSECRDKEAEFRHKAEKKAKSEAARLERVLLQSAIEEALRPTVIKLDQLIKELKG